MKRNIEIEVVPTAQELAEAFCELDADAMAVFFDWVGEYSNNWELSLAMQLQMVCDSGCKNTQASNVMRAIGEYA